VIRNNELAKLMFRWYYDIQDLAFQTPVKRPSTGSPEARKLATYTWNVPGAIVVKKQAPSCRENGHHAVAAVGQVRPQGHRTVGRDTLGHPESQSTNQEAAWQLIEVSPSRLRGSGHVEGGMFPTCLFAGAQVTHSSNEPDPYFGGSQHPST